MYLGKENAEVEANQIAIGLLPPNISTVLLFFILVELDWFLDFYFLSDNVYRDPQVIESWAQNTSAGAET